MNWPLLYLFVSPDTVRMIYMLFALVAIVLLGVWGYRFLRPEETRIRRAVLMLVLIATSGLWYGIEKRRQHTIAQQVDDYRKTAKAHFAKRCESAHLTIYKTVPPQDGVFMMKRGQYPSPAELADQYWMGDPYDYPDSPEDEAWHLLRRKNSLPKGHTDAERGGFDFVEAPHPVEPGRFVRFTVVPVDPKWTGRLRKPIENLADIREEAAKSGAPVRYRLKSDIADRRRARYGYTWEDISTREDRFYWVAGGRFRVIDLETGETVLERVGYMQQRYLAGRSGNFNSSPWLNTDACPHSQEREARTTVSKALGTWDELQKGENK